MASTSIPPTLGKDLVESYLMAEHWKSDLSFYRDELNFLTSLIDKYFVFLLRDKELESIQNLAIRLKYTMQARFELSQHTEAFISALGAFAVNEKNKRDKDVFNTQQITLEKEIVDFVGTFRTLKKDIFEITEDILQKEKIKKLLTP